LIFDRERLNLFGVLLADTLFVQRARKIVRGYPVL